MSMTLDDLRDWIGEKVGATPEHVLAKEDHPYRLPDWRHDYPLEVVLADGESIGVTSVELDEASRTIVIRADGRVRSGRSADPLD